MTASRPADNVRELRQEIEQTRGQLGETVERLVAKTDVKARARDQSAALAGQLKGQAGQARTQAVERARKMRDQLAGHAGGTREPTVLLDSTARRQPSARIAAAGAMVRQTVPASIWQAVPASVRQAVPEPVRRAAAKAADGTRERRVELMTAAGVLVACGVAIWWRRRR
jgi:uncharacterized protein DUF3618